ncbi:hypothetical protein GMRT_10033 [Giardia muris]|uniref:Uncharacterized protein n=1 Tax=Giardia muris TaxID=5742 RepID=A0A4Z1T693_GIAMU|nr:hypothetical protein GMRT_10033 [Giardia muris]|eukprot:TNJ28049.1 hypothetical protein GMRT_10033 [Giardia muris]
MVLRRVILQDSQLLKQSVSHLGGTEGYDAPLADYIDALDDENMGTSVGLAAERLARHITSPRCNCRSIERDVIATLIRRVSKAIEGGLIGNSEDLSSGIQTSLIRAIVSGTTRDELIEHFFSGQGAHAFLALTQPLLISVRISTLQIPTLLFMGLGNLCESGVLPGEDLLIPDPTTGLSIAQLSTTYLLCPRLMQVSSMRVEVHWFVAMLLSRLASELSYEVERALNSSYDKDVISRCLKAYGHESLLLTSGPDLSPVTSIYGTVPSSLICTFVALCATLLDENVADSDTLLYAAEAICGVASFPQYSNADIFTPTIINICLGCFNSSAPSVAYPLVRTVSKLLDAGLSSSVVFNPQNVTNLRNGIRKAYSTCLNAHDETISDSSLTLLEGIFLLISNEVHSPDTVLICDAIINELLRILKGTQGISRPITQKVLAGALEALGNILSACSVDQIILFIKNQNLVIIARIIRQACKCTASPHLSRVLLFSTEIVSIVLDYADPGDIPDILLESIHIALASPLCSELYGTLRTIQDVLGS